MTAVEWFIRSLQERGVEWMATLCGHGLDPLFQAAQRAGMRLVDTRNEQTAGYIAGFSGRLARRPGVCAVSSGVAHANAMTGLVDAHMDGAPMLLVSGAAALRTRSMGHFQDLDQVALAAPVTRYARVIDVPERTVQVLDEAFRAAAGPPPGPVHLTFPMDIQTAEVEVDRMLRPGAPPAPRFERGDPEQAAAAIARARRPVIVAGSGVYYGQMGEAVLGFSETFDVPLTVPIWDRGCVDRPAATFMGVVGAASGGPPILSDADCIVMAGSVPDYRVGFLQPGAVHADAEIVYFDGGWDRLREAYEKKSGRRHSAWLEEACARRDRFRQAVRETAARQARAGTHAVHIIDALRRVIDDSATLLIDGGSIGQWAHHLLCDRYPGYWLTCGRSAVVGWGIAGAMAARLNYPDRPVILLSGDGAFTFNVAELECAVRQKLPFVAIVADDQAWGITLAGHLQKFGAPIASTLGAVAFDRLAQSLGACGVRISEPDRLEPALRQALAAGSVTVLHVPVVGGNPA